MATRDDVRGPKSSGASQPVEPLSIGEMVTTAPGRAAGLGRVDRYELIAKLGQGAFGAVYRARDTVAGIEVAVKALPPLVVHNPEELEHVRANFALVSKLSHPHIAAAHHLHAVETVDIAAGESLRLSRGDYLVVMEYIHGSTLAAWRCQFPGRQVPVPLAIELCGQLAAALDYAHSQRILHRDLKPSNVMVCAPPAAGARGSPTPTSAQPASVVAKLLDFGLAAEIRSSMSRVSKEVGDTSGTRPYMAPEQWTGKQQGPGVDQYALAVVFYELVSGAVPFASAFETNDPLVMMSVAQTQMPEPLAALTKTQNHALLRAMAKDPAQRFASCSDLVAALRGARVAKPRGAAARPGRRWAGLGAGLLVVLAALGWWFCVSGRTIRTNRTDQPQTQPPAPAPPAGPTVELAQVAPVKSEAEIKVERLKALDHGQEFNSRLEQVVQELGQARTFFEAKDYGTALERYQKVVSACAELQSEIAAAAERAPQPVTIVCMADGAETAGATVTVDSVVQSERTPLTVKLSRGQAHQIEVRLDPRAGKRYLPATTAYTVERTGAQSVRLAVREFTGPAEGESWVVPGLGMGFEWIRPGTFLLGSTQAERDWAAGPEGQSESDLSDEGQAPRQATVRRGFWLGRTEVTVGQWRRFVTATGYQTDAEKAGEAWCLDLSRNEWAMVKGKSWRDPNYGFEVKDEHPVVCVSWNDAVAFCQWLTEKETQAERLLPVFEYRLPSECEWEFACRGGREGCKFWWGDAIEDGKGRLNATSNDDLSDKVGPFSPRFPWSDGYGFVAPVDSFGQRGRNGFGLADMLGNVGEWCLDGYDPAGAHAAAWTGDTARRVFRGGSFGTGLGDVRCAYRGGRPPSMAGADLGLRVCCGVGVSAP